MTTKKYTIGDRFRILLGMQPKASTSGYPSYAGASLSRLNADWIGTLLSADQEVRTSLKRMRARCRQLHNSNPYAQRFVSLAKKNVIGHGGIKLEARVAGKGADELDDKVNLAIEEAWESWSKP